MITPTPHQQEAIDWIVGKLTSSTSLVALRGFAGSGKTSCIPALHDALMAHGISVVIGAPTHRAAMVLRSKGLDADTVHSLALLPSFTPDYARAVTWLGGRAAAGPTPDDVLHDDVEGVPYLIAQACEPPLELNAKELRSKNRQFSAQRLLDSLGIRGQDYFREFVSRDQGGCLILDEASMVDAALLAKCQEAFSRICLVGDPGQLPPVDGTGVLAEVEGVTLTELHRQAQDSPIVSLATLAREGVPFWRAPFPGGAVSRATTAEASAFLEGPLLVYRNATREACTRRIRAALGYPTRTLVPGEPLVCRSTDSGDRAVGLYNNALFRVVSVVSPDEPRFVTIVDELGEEQTVRLHLEEIDGKKKDPRATWFRFGYVLTAHTAQGGEWPTVYISHAELQWYHARCVREQEEADHRRWAYTAITRAKNALVFLMAHTFMSPEKESRMAETSTTPNDPIETLPGVPDNYGPEPDDIDEPTLPLPLAAAVTPVPPTLPAGFGEHEAILQGFCQYLQKVMHAWMLEEHRSLTAGIDASLAGIRTWAQEVFASNEHAQYQLSSALATWQKDGLPLKSDPYKAEVRAVAPEGFPVTVMLVKSDAGALVEALPALIGWLKGAGYTAPPIPVEFG